MVLEFGGSCSWCRLTKGAIGDSANVHDGVARPICGRALRLGAELRRVGGTAHSPDWDQLRHLRAAPSANRIKMATKPGSKYYPLYRFLRRSDRDVVRLSLERIEEIIGAELPSSARRSRAFWSNRTEGGYQAQAWIAAGYRAESVDLEEGHVAFRRRRTTYTVTQEEGTIRWDADSIRALREHMGLNQEELAEVLGVRQQTVSEWENAVYEPTRSTAKHLTLVAERAEFPYQVEGNESSQGS